MPRCQGSSKCVVRNPQLFSSAGCDLLQCSHWCMWPFWTLAWALLLVNQLKDDLLQCYWSLWAPFKLFFVCVPIFWRWRLGSHRWHMSCRSQSLNPFLSLKVEEMLWILFINCCFMIVLWLLYHDFTSIFQICGIYKLKFLNRGSLVTCNALIHAFTKAERWEWAYDSLATIRNWGCQKDAKRSSHSRFKCWNSMKSH